jgi:predicted RecB family nuclease
LEFLGILEKVEKPMLLHYGSYETTFFKLMSERHGGTSEGSATDNAITSAVNLLSIIFAQVYFPTYSNGLKEVAGWLGFNWSNRSASGVRWADLRRGWILRKHVRVDLDRDRFEQAKRILGAAMTRKRVRNSRLVRIRDD